MRTKNQITQTCKIIRGFPMTLGLWFSGLLHRLFLVLSVVISIVGVPTSTVLAAPATLQAQTPPICNAPVADMLYANTWAEIWIINPDTKQLLCYAPTSIVTTVTDIRDIAFYQNNPVPFDQNSLYGVTNLAQYIRIDPTNIDPNNDWSATPINMINIMPNLNGSLDGLAFRNTGTGYSSINMHHSGIPEENYSRLIQIDRSTGVGTAMPAETVHPDVWKTDDLAFREDGELFASVRTRSSPNSWLAFVNHNTGGATLIGDIGFPKVVGLSFRHGFLYGLTEDGRLLEINPTSGTGSQIAQFSPSVSLTGFVGLATHVKPGDANGDGKVDGVDYVIWRNNYNRPTTRGRAEGDFNGDGKVDGVDYVIWWNNYGK